MSEIHENQKINLEQLSFAVNRVSNRLDVLEQVMITLNSNLVDKKEAAKITGLKEQTVYAKARRGEIPAIHFGCADATVKIRLL